MVLPGDSDQRVHEDRNTFLKLCGLLALLMFGGWLWLIAWMRFGVPRQKVVRPSEAGVRSNFIAESAPESVQR